MALSKLQKEHLESQLLLSKGGGIYYNEARVDPSTSEATLFIGLGGTGADMLIRIKNEVKRRMVLPSANGKILKDTPNNIAFLAIDTDKLAMAKTWGTATFDQFGGEFCSIAVDDKEAIVTKWKGLAQGGNEEAKWYDQIDAVAALPGAGGKRQIGRLLLFENIREVYSKLESKIRGIVSSGITVVNVIIVTGIGGGTGSGTFIDIAYLSRKVMEGLSVRGRNIFGYIVLPDVNLLNGGNEDALKRNGFAALKELDYWMSTGQDEQNDQFVQNYGNGINARSVASPPFNFCHLLSAQDMKGRPLTYDKVISSMAENIFAYIAAEASSTSDASGNTAMSQMYDNINGYISDLTPNVRYPACYRYLAVGSAKLEIPYEEISTLLAIKVFEKLQTTFALRPTEESFKADMKQLRLIPTEIVHNSLTRDVPASPLDGVANYKYAQIWSDGNTGPKNNTAYFDVHQWLASAFQVNVVKTQDVWAHTHVGFFNTFVTEAMKRPDRGPIYLASLIKSDTKWSIIPVLTNLAQQCDNVAATCLSKSAKIESDLQRAYNEGHSKILNKSRYVNEYIAALGAWMQNEVAMFVYPKRAEEFRKLRDRLQNFYDKVFSKLADVLDTLPEIFRLNYEFMYTAEKEAEKEGRIDTDSRLIWPLKYINKRATELRDFEKLLDESVIRFLDDMTVNLGRWTGTELDNLEEISSSTDIPGFISDFISQQFGGLLSINMETVMKSKEGVDDLDRYLQKALLDMKEAAVPMFSMRSQHSESAAEFGLTSVPEDCINIRTAANNYVKNSKLLVKTSKEKTRLYFVKVVSGVPLFAYSLIEEMEAKYENARKTKLTRDGTHIEGKYWDRDIMPTPVPEATWTPTVYDNPDVKAYNDSMRQAFDFCLKNNVIRPDNEEAPSAYYLYIADPVKADLTNMDLTGLTLQEKLQALRDERDSLWSSDRIELRAMGVATTPDFLKAVRDSTLRFPKICTKIKEQAEIVASFAQAEKELEDPIKFAAAKMCGLILKQGFNIILKKSTGAVTGETLYDITLEKPFAEHEVYLGFRKILDDSLRDNVETMRTEMLRRITTDAIEKAEVLARVDEMVHVYTKELTEITIRIERTAVDKRKLLNNVKDFYSSVLLFATNYRDRYL